MQAAFPQAAGVATNDMAYQAMLTRIPPGWLGLVVASLVAAYMSTIFTQLNWGSSYLVNDFYKRFLRPESTPKELVLVGRISIVILMAIAGALALLLRSAFESFQILLQIGAKTGLLFILRWFWWRLNAASEISAMIISFVVAIYFRLIHPYTELPAINGWEQIIIGVATTTVGWLLVTFLTPDYSPRNFIAHKVPKIREGRRGTCVPCVQHFVLLPKAYLR